MSRPCVPVARRFWQKVKLGEPDQCWIWHGATSTSGKGRYGQISVDGRKQMAHRVAYQLCIGSIPDGLEVCHTCDNPLCCNPQHLWVGTHKQNMQDRQRKDRYSPFAPRGTAHANAKVSEADVLAIRKLYQQGGISQRALAKQYHVSQPTVNYIVNRQWWVHV